MCSLELCRELYIETDFAAVPDMGKAVMTADQRQAQTVD
jgi:hypothetical protein